MRWRRYQQAALGLRNYWFPALLSSEIKDRPVDVKLLGEELVVIRREGKVYCLQARCAHRGVHLSSGRFEFPCTISCIYHGWTYDLSSGKLVGALTDGPASAIVGKVQLQTYPAQERGGVVWVFVGDGEPPPLESDVPEDFFAPNALVWPCATPVRKGNWRVGMEGGLDPAHNSYIHRFAKVNTFRRIPGARGRHRVLNEGRYFSYQTETAIMEADYPGLGRWPRQRWWHRPGFSVPRVSAWLPCGVVVTNFPAAGVASYSWHVPVDEDHWRFFQFQVAPGVTGLERWWYTLKHALVWGPLVQKLFLDDDRWLAGEVTEFYNAHDGWEKERLFHPDIVITGWRKFVEENARAIQEPRRPTFPAAPS